MPFTVRFTARSTSLALALGASVAVGLALGTGALRAGGEDAAEAPVDFAREILPLLSDRCFVCHGPDAKRKDLVRLDSRTGATRDLGGYRAIDPESPEKSEILARINDPDDPMPPKEADKKLSPAERELIGRWIRQGGEYAIHWAFVPPRKRPLPGGGDPGGNPIDAFIRARLDAAGITFAPEAHRATLARRVALILTGLPPEPARLAEFLADERPGAYERLVDDLIASPRYGEHQARYWLDAVRYGDTHGLHLDNRRGIYPYRDWVVIAFNQNLPLDDFITWQLAGDLLPQPTLAQLVATGYVRMNPTTSEGGVLPEEFQAKNNFDRVETLGTVMLGMSLTCARCHTHKYDPIPQEEYYRLLAFFNSTADAPLDGNSYTHGPVVRVPRDIAAWAEWSALESARDELFDAARVSATAEKAAIDAHAAATAGWSAEGWRVTDAVPVDAPVPAAEAWREAEGLPGRSKQKLPADGRAVWVSFDVATPADQTLFLTHSGGAGSRVLVEGEPIETAGESNDGAGIVPLHLAGGSHRVHLKLIGAPSAPPIEARLESPWQAVAASTSWDAVAERDRLLALADARGPLADLELGERALSVLEQIVRARADFTTSLVARDLEQRRETRLLRRGEYNLPIGEPLEPGVLAVMGGLPEDAPLNRLGLARWLTAPGHPLVARVLINRVWQRTFGDGLVRSPEDFGLQGRQPTHPELLDWLAIELQESGWDLKHMLRLMVTSRTFRQRSAWRDDVDDPENRLLARGPRHRLDAEVIRDVALWGSGLLDPAMGGEGVKPYQPGGLWLAMAHPASNTKRYVRDRGKKLYRRSLYVYWKRTSPHPMMTLFDAPSRESSCVRRSRTSTALQSLGLLNETQRIEMSRAFAERLLRERQEDAARLDLLFTLVACRQPTDRERAACEKLLAAMRERYAGALEDARALLSTGEAPRDETLDPAEHAAWSQVVVTVLASDVAILLY